MRTSDSPFVVVLPDKRRLMRVGSWSLAFFALKGLAWLLVPLIVMRLA